MLKNPKAKGSRNERRTIEFLSSQGYRCCKSGGSLGVWDVIGVSHFDVVLVQVKTGRWPGTREMEAIRDFPIPDGVRKLLHRWMPRKKDPESRWI